MPSYQDDILKELADMRRKLDQLAQEAQRREPISKFSATVTFDLPPRLTTGAVLLNQSSPSTPSGGAHIYGRSGAVWIKQSNGADFQVEPPPAPFVKANNVANPPAYTGGTAPGTYNQGMIQDLMDQVAALTTTQTNLMNSMRTTGGTGSGLMG